MTTAIPTHIHISEREADGTWEDCTWDSGLEFYRDAFDARKPATHAEAQLLRRASGEPATGGSNLGDFRRGVKVRYGATLPAAISNRNILTALKPGYCSTVQGSMQAFGPTHRLSAYDRNFDGAHAVYLANVGGVLYWCDPEAPTTAAVPVIVSAAEVKAFVSAFAGEALVAPIKTLPVPVPAQEATVALKTYLPGYTCDVKSGSNIRSEPRIASTKLHALTSILTSVQVVGTVEGDKDPANGSTVWYELFHDGRSEFTAKDNVINLKAPAPAAPPYPDVRPALTEAQAALSAQTAALKAANEKLAIASVTVGRYESLKAAFKLLIS